mgnify:CR=1 FL=1
MHTNKNTEFDFFDEGSGAKKTGMKMPEGYLGRLNEDILSKIEAEEKNNSKIQPIGKFTRIMSVVAIAASLLWGGLFMFNNQVETPQVEIAEVTIDEVADYYEWDEYAMAESLTDTEIENLYLEEEYISADEAYDYILDENYSEYTLLENL